MKKVTLKSPAFYYSICISILIVKVECNVKGKVPTAKNVKVSNWEPPKATVTANAKWIQTALDKHNYYRDRHQATRLTLNNTLSEISQAWCNYLLRKGIESYNRNKSIDYFEHNDEVLKKAHLGENLYYSVNYAETNATLPIRRWYEEIKDYDFATGTVKSTSNPKALVGHLTQLLWKDTKQMGTSFASAKLSTSHILTFVCANYFPPGNVNAASGFRKKYYLANVLPLLPQFKESEEIGLMEKPNVIPIRWPALIKANVTTENDWIEKALDMHNKLRGGHGVPPLKLNPELNQISQSWSQYLLKAGVASFNNHRKIDFYRKNDQTSKYGIGENLMYFITDGPVDAEIAVKMWYQERQYYNFTTGRKHPNASKSASTEHFTQIVWKSSSEMGMSYSSSKVENGQMLTFIVANYFPSKYAVDVSWERNCLNNVPAPTNSAQKIVFASWFANIFGICYFVKILIMLQF